MTELQIHEEYQTVLDWRLLRLMQAGYTRKSAIKIAEADYVDLHKACQLIRSCEEKLALKILL